MNNKNTPSEEFTLPTTPVRYSIRNGSLIIGEGENYGTVSFDKETGTIDITPCVVSEGE